MFSSHTGCSDELNTIGASRKWTHNCRWSTGKSRGTQQSFKQKSPPGGPNPYRFICSVPFMTDSLIYCPYIWYPFDITSADRLHLFSIPLLILLNYPADIAVDKTYYPIHWIEIYPVDSVTHRLNNWVLAFIRYAAFNREKYGTCR